MPPWPPRAPDAAPDAIVNRIRTVLEFPARRRAAAALLASGALLGVGVGVGALAGTRGGAGAHDLGARTHAHATPFPLPAPSPTGTVPSVPADGSATEPGATETETEPTGLAAPAQAAARSAATVALSLAEARTGEVRPTAETIGAAILGASTETRRGGGQSSPRRDRGAAPAFRGLEGAATPLVGNVVPDVPIWIWFLVGALALIALGAGLAAGVLARRAKRTGAAAAALRRRAITDPLTGVLNRRGWDDRIVAEIARAQRTGRPLAIAYLDVAGLKTVNDTYGHHAGDRLLQATARLLEENSRAEDAAARLGGDEWAVLLPEQAEDGAKVFARRLSRRLPEVQRDLGIESDWSLTVGWATYPHDGEDPATLLAAADRRLYARRGIRLT